MASEQSRQPDKTKSLLDDIARRLMKSASVASRILAGEPHTIAQKHTDIAYQNRPNEPTTPDQK